MQHRFIHVFRASKQHPGMRPASALRKRHAVQVHPSEHQWCVKVHRCKGCVVHNHDSHTRQLWVWYVHLHCRLQDIGLQQLV